MKRWHEEQHRSFKRWKLEMKLHGYDWRNPPTDPSACHCVTGVGFFRKRHPLDCGNTRCGCCHPEKHGFYKKVRRREKYAAIKEGLEDV